MNPWPTVSNSVRIQATSQSVEGTQKAVEASVEAAVKGRTKGIKREAGRGVCPLCPKERLSPHSLVGFSKRRLPCPHYPLPHLASHPDLMSQH